MEAAGAEVLTGDSLYRRGDWALSLGKGNALSAEFCLGRGFLWFYLFACVLVRC